MVGMVDSGSRGPGFESYHIQFFSNFFGGDELKASYLKWNGNSLSFTVYCDKKLGKVWRGISSDMMGP